MANPEKHNEPLEGLRRANRDDEQHWREKGWEKIEGGRDRTIVRGPNSQEPEITEDTDRPVIGADYTRSPFDPSLARDEQGRIREDRADVLRGYGEPIPERNYPLAYNKDELINPDLNPAMTYPPKTTAPFKILAIALGLVLFGLLAALLYWRFLAPVRRSPEGTNSKVQRHEMQRKDNRTTAALQQFAGFVSRMNERR